MKSGPRRRLESAYRDPDELLRKLSCGPDIRVAKDCRNDQHESKQHDRVRRETKVISTPVDTAAVEREGRRWFKY